MTAAATQEAVRRRRPRKRRGRRRLRRRPRRRPASGCVNACARGGGGDERLLSNPGGRHYDTFPCDIAKIKGTIVLGAATRNRRVVQLALYHTKCADRVMHYLAHFRPCNRRLKGCCGRLTTPCLRCGCCDVTVGSRSRMAERELVVSRESVPSPRPVVRYPAGMPSGRA